MQEKKKTENINFKELILKYSNYWYFFILSIFFFLFVAFLYNRYTIPEYNVSTTIEIVEDSEGRISVDVDDIVPNIIDENKIANEIIILKSYSLIENVIRDLNLGISYYQHGIIQTNEILEKNSPFIVHISKSDSNQNQITGHSFEIDIINEEQFNLAISCNEGFSYNLSKNKFNKDSPLKVDINKKCKFGEKISSRNFSFIINKNNNFPNKQFGSKNKSYSFKLHQPYKLAQKIRNSLNINPINKDATVLKLSIKDKNPNKNILILDKITELYINNAFKEKISVAESTAEFLDNQLRKIEDSLRFIDEERQYFVTKNKDLVFEYKDDIGFSSKKELKDDLLKQRIKIINYNSLLNYVKNDESKKISSPISLGIENNELINLIKNLHILYDKKRELEETTTNKHPTYKSNLTQIDYTKKTIVSNVENLIISAQKIENELKTEFDKLSYKENALPEVQKKEIMLNRRSEFFSQQKISLNESLAKAQAAATSEKPDESIIDPARLESIIPVSPKKGLVYFIAIFLGILTPITVISIRDFFNDTIKSKSDLEKVTSIPILGLIGHSDNAKSLIINNSGKSVIAESLRAIRTNIQYLASEKKSKVISVTSSIGGEGKTFTAMNLAAIFALANYKTVLIGADLRKPKLHKDFDIDQSQGLSSLLINKSSLSKVTKSTEIDNLFVIGSGPTPPNPSELLDSETMNKIINDLKKKYDYVIFDTPPIGLVTDGVIIMKHTDINLYVVRHAFTKNKSLDTINKIYNRNQVNNIQIIINDFKQKSSSYGYGYGYGYGYEDGYGYYENDK